MTYLESYAQEKSDIIPLKTPDGIRLLKKDSIIAVDVDGRQLQLKTLKGNFYITERLYQFKERINSTDIVQVSKQSLININHLNKLEASFSGNMLAILINDVKVMVSRRYLKNLEQKLGL
ncbi:LytTR family DNA-binding domain-containing protein [Streptococcus urinalis]|uniref:LytTr DNA-binding domain protein n=1 Tax=Streptococcus urinalis 2285-97 TaxID=764291 RepID=G5KH94_9STRE|nr:LytTR family DNA-binding domain-containing protein [Streptococcus urinalis]EHJ55717.1 LytTr DNA-binding domain protein [Streptococcus urinalis 2285-97]